MLELMWYWYAAMTGWIASDIWRKIIFESFGGGRLNLKLNIKFGKLYGYWVYTAKVMVPNNRECER